MSHRAKSKKAELYKLPVKRKPAEKFTAKKATAIGTGKGAKSVGSIFEDLIGLQSRLRGPNGCPWDRKQTHASLRTYLVEETYEVLDALDSGDSEKFSGELGDLLLQIVFHSELAAEAGRFSIADVIERVHAKMVRRHPHVFGNVKANTSAQVLKNWEQIKLEERRAERGARQGAAARPAKEAPASIIDAVPRSLPALMEAHQLTRRAANVGFDWKHHDGLFEKLAEEAVELRAALHAGDQDSQEEEMGDLLFVCVNLARFLGLDAEVALKKANRKFGRRFRDMEGAAASTGQSLAKLSMKELERLWGIAKAKEKHPPRTRPFGTRPAGTGKGQR